MGREIGRLSGWSCVLTGRSRAASFGREVDILSGKYWPHLAARPSTRKRQLLTDTVDLLFRVEYKSIRFRLESDRVNLFGSARSTRGLQSRRIVQLMASATPSRRPAGVAPRCVVFVATATQIMKLFLKQWPHILVRHMTAHAILAAGVVDIVMVAADATNSSVIRMREVHRQNRFPSSIVVIKRGTFGGDWRTK